MSDSVSTGNHEDDIFDDLLKIFMTFAADVYHIPKCFEVFAGDGHYKTVRI